MDARAVVEKIAMPDVLHSRWESPHARRSHPCLGFPYSCRAIESRAPNMGCLRRNTKLLTSTPQLSEDLADRSKTRHLLHQWLSRDTKADAGPCGTKDYFHVALNQDLGSPSGQYSRSSNLDVPGLGDCSKSGHITPHYSDVSVLMCSPGTSGEEIKGKSTTDPPSKGCISKGVLHFGHRERFPESILVRTHGTRIMRSRPMRQAMRHQ